MTALIFLLTEQEFIFFSFIFFAGQWSVSQSVPEKKLEEFFSGVKNKTRFRGRGAGAEPEKITRF